MRKFTFDVKAFFQITVEADNEAKARAVVDSLNGAIVPIHGQEVGLDFDGEHDLVMINGEDV